MLGRMLVVSAAVGMLALAGAARAAGKDAGMELQTITPAHSDQPLVNPGMGIYLNGTLDPSLMPPEAWHTDVIAIG